MVSEMSRYIDADAVYKHLRSGCAYVIWEEPTIDIVRCGECRHRITGRMGKMCIGRHPDDFCSYGERKESE